MKTSTRVILIALVVVLAAAGLSWYLFLHTPPSPPPLDIRKVGGTVLVYEVADDTDKATNKLDELARAVRERIRDIAIEPPSVETAPPRRIEIAIVREPNHDDHVQQVKELLAMIGHLEFRIVANRSDDRLAQDNVDDFFNAASADWTGLRKAVQEKFLEDEADGFAGVAFDDVEGLVSQLLKRKPKLNARQVRQFIETVYRPGKQLLLLRQAANAGLPPPPPVPKPDNHYILANEGDRGASYTWMPLSRNEMASLSGGREAGWEATVSASVQSGQPFRSFAGFPLVGFAGFEAVYYARQKSLPRGKPAYDCFILMRDPEKGKEVTGAQLERAREDIDRDGKRAVGLRFNRKGGDLFYEMTSRNKPDSEQGKRHLAVILDGIVMVAPSLNSPIRDAAIIEGRFTPAEVNNMVRVLRAGELPLPLKPIPVLEKVIEPGQAP